MKKHLFFMLALFALYFTAVPLSAQTIWDGTADVSWYDASETSFDIYTPEQLAGVAQLVNNGTTSFSGKTLNLANDLWLNSTGEARSTAMATPSTTSTATRGAPSTPDFSVHWKTPARSTLWCFTTLC